MNAARSPTSTTDLPSCSARSRTSSITCLSVTTVCTTSMRPMTVAGLKKCTPSTRDGRLVAAARWVTDMVLVFVASTTSGGTSSSSLRNRAVFRSRSSEMASMTISHAARAARSAARSIRASTSSRSCSLSLPAPTARAVAEISRCCPRASDSWSFSTATTEMPARARASAIPAPPVPRPTTPILENCRATGDFLSASPNARVAGARLAPEPDSDRSGPGQTAADGVRGAGSGRPTPRSLQTERPRGLQCAHGATVPGG